MTQHLYILTGTSRGMGLAMATQLLSQSNRLLCISRSTNDSLTAQARDQGCSLEQAALDLQDSQGAARYLAQWLTQLAAPSFASATLINNAGVLARLGPLHASEPQDLSSTLRVGLETPMLLGAEFLRHTRHWPIPKKLLNISSGLGHRAMAAQSAYCAAKAGMDHFSRCVALEEALQAHPVQVCSLAPGVIDTNMQAQLRSTSTLDFPDQPSFADLKAKGQLASPASAAARVLAYLARPNFGTNPVADVRDVM